MTYKEFIQNILNSRGRFGCKNIYCERHHIVPRCMGGVDDEDNLIDLYAREHFIAHKLLAQENPDNDSLVYAWGCMAWAKNDNQKRYELTPEEYEDAKISFSKAISDMAKERLSVPENNPMYGVHRFGEENPMFGKKHSEYTKENISEKAKARYTNKENHPWFGKHHTEESRKKMKEHHADVSGENHPMYGKHHSEESRKKMGENHKSMRGQNSPCSRRVAQCSKLGDIFYIFDSTGEAERATGVNQSSISRCANGKLKSAGGYVWKYVNENNE